MTSNGITQTKKRNLEHPTFDHESSQTNFSK